MAAGKVPPVSKRSRNRIWPGRRRGGPSRFSRRVGSLFRRLNVETLEPRRVLSLTNVAITSGQQDQLVGGLDGLALWADTLDDHDLAAQLLPTVGQSIGEAVDLGDLLTQGIAQPVADYLSGDLTPTTDELVTALQSLDTTMFDNVTLSVTNVSGGQSTAPGDNEIVFNIEFQADRSLSVNPSLGPDGEALGIGFGSTIGADATLTFNFSFGIDLTSGLSDEEAFFIRAASLTMELDANVPALPTGPMSIGFFEAQTHLGQLVARRRFGSRLWQTPISTPLATSRWPNWRAPRSRRWCRLPNRARRAVR